MATRSIVSLEEAHNRGAHKKIPRQSCPACRRIRDAQWQRNREGPRPSRHDTPWLESWRRIHNA